MKVLPLTRVWWLPVPSASPTAPRWRKRSPTKRTLRAKRKATLPGVASSFGVVADGVRFVAFADQVEAGLVGDVAVAAARLQPGRVGEGEAAEFEVADRLGGGAAPFDQRFGNRHLDVGRAQICCQGYGM